MEFNKMYDLMKCFQMEVDQDRFTIAKSLSLLMNSLHQDCGVREISYVPEDENMVIRFRGGGERVVSVWGDGPAACIRDIMKGI